MNFKDCVKEINEAEDYFIYTWCRYIFERNRYILYMYMNTCINKYVINAFLFMYTCIYILNT